MAQDVEWVKPREGPQAGPRSPGVSEVELRELRDEIRRLKEQVAALANRTREEGTRIPTYVPGLDEALQGGIPRGHVLGIVGPGGSMKTSLALYAMTRNALAGIRGVYVTIEEDRDSILQTMRRLGLGDSGDFIVDISRLRMEHAGAEEVRDWVRVLEDYLTRRRERDPLGLVVIDSLDALMALARVQDARTELFRFFHFLRSLGVTAVVIAEQNPVRPGVDQDVNFLADGVVELRFSGAGEGKVQLLVRVAKMRHTDHSRDYLVLSYGSQGFVASPYEIPKTRRWGRRT